jgi:hypothetical protein
MSDCRDTVVRAFLAVADGAGLRPAGAVAGPRVGAWPDPRSRKGEGGA